MNSHVLLAKDGSNKAAEEAHGGRSINTREIGNDSTHSLWYGVLRRTALENLLIFQLSKISGQPGCVVCHKRSFLKRVIGTPAFD